MKKRRLFTLIFLFILVSGAALYYCYQTSLMVYYDADEIKEQLFLLEKKYPKWAKVYNLNHLLNQPPTHEGRSLYALQVSLYPEKIEDERKILLTGLHHSDEFITHHSVLDLAKEVLQQTAIKSSHYREWLETSSVWFVPVVNPDGLNYALTKDPDWRNNRSSWKNKDGTTGVDLNRNYRFHWGKKNAWHAGSKPLSEPETQVMDQLNKRLNFQFLLSFHSYGNEVLFPYCQGTIAETEIYQKLKNDLAQKLKYTSRRPRGTGEEIEHHYQQYGTLAFTVEVGLLEKQPYLLTYHYQIYPTIKKVLPWLLMQLKEPVVSIQVKDSVSGEPLIAKLILHEIAFQEEEKRHTDSFGRYWWYLSEGEYTLSIQRKGYKSFKAKIVAKKETDSFYSFSLKKE